MNENFNSENTINGLKTTKAFTVRQNASTVQTNMEFTTESLFFIIDFI